MVIRTISQRYQVIRRLFGSNQVKGYVCQEEKDPSKKRYLLVKVIKPGLSKRMLPYFMELNDRQDKGDFLNYFISKRSLWIVFRYYEHSLLHDKMRSNIRLKERLEVSRTMMEQILIQDLPYYLQYEALNPKNTVISDVPEVHFNFLLIDTEMLEKCDMTDVQKRLADSMEILFEPELKIDAIPQLKHFVKGLQEKDYSEYSQIYRDYRRLYEFLAPIADEELPEKKSLLLRPWEHFKKNVNVLKRVLYMAVIVALVGMIVYAFVKPETMSDNKVQFNQIGTLRIQQEDGKGDEPW